MTRAKNNGKVVFYRDAKSELRWRAVARNGNIIADSGEGYERMRGAENGLDALITLLSGRFKKFMTAPNGEEVLLEVVEEEV